MPTVQRWFVQDEATGPWPAFAYRITPQEPRSGPEPPDWETDLAVDIVLILLAFGVRARPGKGIGAGTLALRILEDAGIDLSRGGRQPDIVRRLRRGRLALRMQSDSLPLDPRGGLEGTLCPLYAQGDP